MMTSMLTYLTTADATVGDSLQFKKTLAKQEMCLTGKAIVQVYVNFLYFSPADALPKLGVFQCPQFKRGDHRKTESD